MQRRKRLANGIDAPAGVCSTGASRIGRTIWSDWITARSATPVVRTTPARAAKSETAPYEARFQSLHAIRAKDTRRASSEKDIAGADARHLTRVTIQEKPVDDARSKDNPAKGCPARRPKIRSFTAGKPRKSAPSPRQKLRITVDKNKNRVFQF